MDELIQNAADNLMKQRDKFLIDEIEKFAGKFEHEGELKTFIKNHCVIERHLHDQCILRIKGFPVIQWRESIVNEFDFKTGKATVKIIWNQ